MTVGSRKADTTIIGKTKDFETLVLRDGWTIQKVSENVFLIKNQVNKATKRS